MIRFRRSSHLDEAKWLDVFHWIFVENGLSISIYLVKSSVGQCVCIWQKLCLGRFVCRGNIAIQFNQYSNNFPERLASTENNIYFRGNCKSFQPPCGILLQQVKEIILSSVELLVPRASCAPKKCFSVFLLLGGWGLEARGLGSLNGAGSGASTGIGTDGLDGLLVVVEREIAGGRFIPPPASPLKHISPKIIGNHISIYFPGKNCTGKSRKWHPPTALPLQSPRRRLPRPLWQS